MGPHCTRCMRFGGVAPVGLIQVDPFERHVVLRGLLARASLTWWTMTGALVAPAPAREGLD
ncbi:MAG: hypothetical protein VKI83_04045 [Synechococcaceae cyanobacterium]|nr:hypothetical protein [Synechococcaceae cyanobacterium]